MHPNTPSNAPQPEGAPSDSQPTFPRCPGETPRALCAFITFFNLGPRRSLKAVANSLGERLGTVKKWSGRFHWAERILAFETGCLQKQAADWNRRNTEHLEQQWDATQKLLDVAQCYLETVDEQQLAKVSLSQATRAIQTASNISRAVLQEAKTTPQQSACNPLANAKFRANWEKLYGKNGRFASVLNQSDPTSPTPNQSV